MVLVDKELYMHFSAISQLVMGAEEDIEANRHKDAIKKLLRVEYLERQAKGEIHEKKLLLKRKLIGEGTPVQAEKKIEAKVREAAKLEKEDVTLEHVTRAAIIDLRAGKTSLAKQLLFIMKMAAATELADILRAWKKKPQPA